MKFFKKHVVDHFLLDLLNSEMISNMKNKERKKGGLNDLKSKGTKFNRLVNYFLEKPFASFMLFFLFFLIVCIVGLQILYFRSGSSDLWFWSSDKKATKCAGSSCTYEHIYFVAGILQGTIGIAVGFAGALVAIRIAAMGHNILKEQKARDEFEHVEELNKNVLTPFHKIAYTVFRLYSNQLSSLEFLEIIGVRDGITDMIEQKASVIRKNMEARIKLYGKLENQLSKLIHNNMAFQLWKYNYRINKKPHEKTNNQVLNFPNVIAEKIRYKTMILEDVVKYSDDQLVQYYDNIQLHANLLWDPSKHGKALINVNTEAFLVLGLELYPSIKSKNNDSYGNNLSDQNFDLEKIGIEMLYAIINCFPKSNDGIVKGLNEIFESENNPYSYIVSSFQEYIKPFDITKWFGKDMDNVMDEIRVSNRFN